MRSVRVVERDESGLRVERRVGERRQQAAGGPSVNDETELDALRRLLYDADERERLLLRLLTRIKSEARSRSWLRESYDDDGWADRACYCSGCPSGEDSRTPWNERSFRYEVGGLIDDLVKQVDEGVETFRKLWMAGWWDTWKKACPCCGHVQGRNRRRQERRG